MGIFSKDKARDELAKGNTKPATDFNRQVQEKAKNSDRCGGCIGAGTGGRCCICGKARG